MEGPGAEWFSLLLRCSHFLKPSAERLVDQILQSCIAGSAQPLEFGGDIVIDCQCGSHASTHIKSDVLMSTDVRESNRAAEDGRLAEAGLPSCHHRRGDVRDDERGAFEPDAEDIGLR